MEYKKERVFKNTYSRKRQDQEYSFDEQVTDKHVHDIKVLPELIDDIAKSDNVITIGKLLVLMALMILQYIQIFGRKWCYAMH